MECVVSPQGVMEKAHEPWGKLVLDQSGRVSDRLAFVDHSVDVAACFRELCRIPSVARALDFAAGRQLRDMDIDRLSVLALLHDVGKCNHGFQAKADPSARRVAGHVRELAPLFDDADLAQRLAEVVDLEATSQWFDRAEGFTQMMLASVSHHGTQLPLRLYH